MAMPARAPDMAIAAMFPEVKVIFLIKEMFGEYVSSF